MLQRFAVVSQSRPPGPSTRAASLSIASAEGTFSIRDSDATMSAEVLARGR